MSSLLIHNIGQIVAGDYDRTRSWPAIRFLRATGASLSSAAG